MNYLCVVKALENLRQNLMIILSDLLTKYSLVLLALSKTIISTRSIILLLISFRFTATKSDTHLQVSFTFYYWMPLFVKHLLIYGLPAHTYTHCGNLKIFLPLKTIVFSQNTVVPTP